MTRLRAVAAVVAATVLVAAVLAAGCSSLAEARDVGSRPATIWHTKTALANATVSSDGTWATLTYVPDGTETEVAIAPWDPTQGEWGEDTWIAARWAPPPGPVAHSVLRTRAPAAFQLLVVKDGAAVQYLIGNPYT